MSEQQREAELSLIEEELGFKLQELSDKANALVDEVFDRASGKTSDLVKDIESRFTPTELAFIVTQDVIGRAQRKAFTGA